jgi:hypothetical protein
MEFKVTHHYIQKEIKMILPGNETMDWMEFQSILGIFHIIHIVRVVHCTCSYYIVRVVHCTCSTLYV